ncbi:nuclease A inhibitor family protein [Calothrix sp. UHCC 0171]|uniref:nuclease A inhibitor family protein n=1 Tax=Calothrix sp. UHCC 0171 TaxID=3110245 RepID=UPI002B1F34F8|nr:nuclease A inhibitor family protein [Calothrix sp. UHCC 0171]MEA5572343.1 nuclease A inhibitor family protein [Calothrix sp. UHCC 0171]
MEKSYSNSNQILIEKLKQACDRLLFISESEYPWEVFLWEFAEEKPEISSDLIFQQIDKSADNKIEFIDIDSLFAIATLEQSWHGEAEKATVKKYQHLVKSLQENLRDIKVARIGEIEIDIYILGKTSSNDIAGLFTKVIET